LDLGGQKERRKTLKDRFKKKKKKKKKKNGREVATYL